MNLTNEQFTKIISDWTNSGLRDPFLLTDPTNANVLLAIAQLFYDKNGTLPNPGQFQQLILMAGRTELGGGLRYSLPGDSDISRIAAVVRAVNQHDDTSEPLPFDEYPILKKNINTMEDVKRLKTLDAHILKQYSHLTPTSKPWHELNIRIAEIQRRNIQGPSSLETTTKTASDEGYRALRSRVARITPRDCGESTSMRTTGDPWYRVNRFKEKMNEVIDANEKRGNPAEAVDAYITKELNNFGSSSIR